MLSIDAMTTEVVVAEANKWSKSIGIGCRLKKLAYRTHFQIQKLRNSLLLKSCQFCLIRPPLTMWILYLLLFLVPLALLLAANAPSLAAFKHGCCAGDFISQVAIDILLGILAFALVRAFLFYGKTTISFESKSRVSIHFPLFRTLLMWAYVWIRFPFNQSARLGVMRQYKNLIFADRKAVVMPVLQNAGVREIFIESHFFDKSEDKCRALIKQMVCAKQIEAIDIGLREHLAFTQLLQLSIFQMFGATIRPRSRKVLIKLRPLK